MTRSLFVKPFALKRLASNPINHVSIYLGANWLEYVESQTITTSRVNVENSEARIQPEGGSGSASFRF